MSLTIVGKRQKRKKSTTQNDKKSRQDDSSESTKERSSSINTTAGQCAIVLRFYGKNVLRVSERKTVMGDGRRRRRRMDALLMRSQKNTGFTPYNYTENDAYE